MEGIGKIVREGKIAIAVYDGKWCATKGYNDKKITVTEYVDDECVLPPVNYEGYYLYDMVDNVSITTFSYI